MLWLCLVIISRLGGLPERRYNNTSLARRDDAGQYGRRRSASLEVGCGGEQMSVEPSISRMTNTPMETSCGR